MIINIKVVSKISTNQIWRHSGAGYINIFLQHQYFLKFWGEKKVCLFAFIQFGSYMHKQNQKQSVFHEHLESWEIWAVYNEKYWYICIVREPVTLTMLLLWEQSLLMSCWPRPTILPDWSGWDRLFLGKSREAHMVDRSLSNLLFWFGLSGPHHPTFNYRHKNWLPQISECLFKIGLNWVCCYKNVNE